MSNCHFLYDLLLCGLLLYGLLLYSLLLLCLGLHGPLMLSFAGDKAESFTARNLANTLWALAKMGHNPGGRLLSLLEAETLKKVGGFNPQNIANTLWAFANLGAFPHALHAFFESTLH